MREQTCRKIYFSSAKAGNPPSSQLANTQKLSCKSRSESLALSSHVCREEEWIPRKFHSFFPRTPCISSPLFTGPLRREFAAFSRLLCIELFKNAPDVPRNIYLTWKRFGTFLTRRKYRENNGVNDDSLSFDDILPTKDEEFEILKSRPGCLRLFLTNVS